MFSKKGAATIPSKIVFRESLYKPNPSKLFDSIRDPGKDEAYESITNAGAYLDEGHSKR